jgi:hypothetical protein
MHLTQLKSGDLIEWYYVRNNRSVITNEKLFSSTMTKWVYVDNISIIISTEGLIYGEFNNINFINSRGKICQIWYNDVSPQSGLSTVGARRL